MYLAGVLVLALSAVVLISAHPLDSQQEPQAVEPATIVREKRTIGILRDLFPNFSQDAENSVNDNRKREVRSKRSPDEQAEEEEEEDLEPDATGDNEVASDNEAESDGEAVDEEDPRNKRFLNFNLGASGDAAGGSGGGSGNFLFDIIRLVAGSGNTQGGDASHAGLEEAKEEAVPGPLTRLFVVANKGVAALIQDLILRLAQTSERIVNFKAKLITSII